MTLHVEKAGLLLPDTDTAGLQQLRPPPASSKPPFSLEALRGSLFVQPTQPATWVPAACFPQEFSQARAQQL